MPLARCRYNFLLLFLMPCVLNALKAYWYITVHRFTSQVVFSDPYTESDINRWTSPELDEAASALRTDVPLRLNVSRLKEKFMTSCEV